MIWDLFMWVSTVVYLVGIALLKADRLERQIDGDDHV
jgi:hypothetical protein